MKGTMDVHVGGDSDLKTFMFTRIKRLISELIWTELTPNLQVHVREKRKCIFFWRRTL